MACTRWSTASPFLLRLEELIAEEPFDIVNLRVEVPTVTGARQTGPSFMTFEVTSERPADVTELLGRVRVLVHDAGLVLVNQKNL